LTQVIFGAGQVGSHLAESLLRSGQKVRVAKRGAAGIPAGADAALGDATDPGFCRDATRDATVVYHCMNPPYDHRIWEDLLPKFAENLIAAAGRSGARLVVLDNLYAIGAEDTGPIDENTPFNPCSRKGEIRARVAGQMMDAHRRGDVQLSIGRASDFYGPRGAGTHFAERFWKPVFRGKPAEFLPNPDTPHTYHFIPDVAAGLQALGAGPDESFGRSWMLPCAPAAPSRTMVERFSRALGSEIRIRGMPKSLLRAMGLFLPLLREVNEMLYQWERAFIVDDSQFRARFGDLATDPDEGARLTLQWARSRFS
jgi:nucleoside-diphosphate-sugar epimerase